MEIDNEQTEKVNMVMNSKGKINRVEGLGEQVSVGEGAVSNRVIRKGFTGRCHLDKDLRIIGSHCSGGRGTANAKAVKEEGKA